LDSVKLQLALVFVLGVVILDLARGKSLKFKVKNEIVTKNGEDTLVQVDFETSAQAEVTWCRILKTNPDECVPIADTDGYSSNGKVSLFYFVYMGRYILQKANNEDVLAFRINVNLKNGRTLYSHMIPIPEAEAVQESKTNIVLPKILEAPKSEIRFQAGDKIHQACIIESKDTMTIRWFYLPPGNKTPVLLYAGEDGSQGRMKIAAHVSKVSGSLREGTELDIPHATEADTGIYMCEFTSRETGDVTQLFGTVNVA